MGGIAFRSYYLEQLESCRVHELVCRGIKRPVSQMASLRVRAKLAPFVNSIYYSMHELF